MSQGAFYGGHRKISAKTAAYQVLPSDLGTMFTTRGNLASITFTLPNTATIETGWWCKFFNVADFEFIIASYASSDNIVTKNDAGADTLTWTTATELIGGAVEVTWDGTGWLAELKNEETVTVGVA